MSNLTEFLSATGNDFASVADAGITAGDVSGFIDTGSYALNALLSGSIYGGFPSNKVTGLGAPSSTGKTFFALAGLKHFLDANPEGIGMIFESESAISRQMLADRGIDVKRVGIVPVVTVQDMRTQVIRVIDNYEKTPVKERVPLFFILDSLGNLSTKKEVEDILSGADTQDMTRAKLIKGAFRVFTLRLGRAQIPFVVTNHVYDDVGGGPYAQAQQSGGSGLIYAASTILTLSKAREKNNEGEVVGNIITATVEKGRFTREKSKVKVMLRYDGGMDRYYYLTELAIEAGIFKKVSTRIELPDGSKVFQSSIEKSSSPEVYFTKDVLDKIDEYCKLKFMFVNGAIAQEDSVSEDATEKE